MPYKDLEVRRKYQRAYQVKWRNANPERSKEIWEKSFQKTFNEKHAIFRARVNNTVRKYTRRNRLLALQKYGGKCVCCLETMSEFLTFDHVSGDGAAHRKELKSSRTLYMQLVKEPINPRFQILCWNCNLAKEKYKSCPHQSAS